MNILHLTLSNAYGGRRQMIANLAGAQRTLGQRCTLALLSDEPGPTCEQFDFVHCLGRRSLFDWRAVGRLHQLCNEKQIAIIHAHDAASQSLVAMLRVLRPRSSPRALMTFHRSINIGSKTWRDRLRNRIACAIVGPVVAVSEERREHYYTQNGVSSSKVLCIHNGIDADRFRPDPEVRVATRMELGLTENAVLIGAAGHFGHEKGLDLVIEAFRLMIRKCKRVPLKLVILGTGADASRIQLEKLAAECDGQVQFLGFQLDIARWFKALDIFLHSPRQEAFGLVVAEAMAAAVPVVATRVGAIPEIIRDRSCGWLVEPESPLALANAALQLIESPNSRAQIGQSARKLVNERFSARIQAMRYLKLYEALLSGVSSFDAPYEFDCAEAPRQGAYAINGNADHARLDSRDPREAVI